MNTGTPESSADSLLREIVTKALREEASLPVNLDSLNFYPGILVTSLLRLLLPSAHCSERHFGSSFKWLNECDQQKEE